MVLVLALGNLLSLRFLPLGLRKPVSMALVPLVGLGGLSLYFKLVLTRSIPLWKSLLGCLVIGAAGLAFFMSPLMPQQAIPRLGAVLFVYALLLWIMERMTAKGKKKETTPVE